HHFKLEPLVVFRHEKTPKGQIYVQLLGFSSRGARFSFRHAADEGTKPCATPPRSRRIEAGRDGTAAVASFGVDR
ncbi:hypothetical protein, partial [Burkholderia pseudomallei]|uniref:hypothetical protein n=1 Tax=Burkholderia pseudomallei TaxID=28450 RepID=UPI001C7E8EED